MFVPPAMMYRGGPTLLQALQAASLTTNLFICLDAGDPNSYTSGQTWTDRSGQGNHFYLGADGNAGASDPTLVGQAGSRRAYFNHDGGDYFTLSVANPTAINNMHKNNAAWAWCGLLYHPSPEAHRAFGTDASSASNIGCDLTLTNGTFNLEVNNGGAGAAVLDVSSAADVISASAWHFLALSIDEAAGAGGSFFYVDGNYAQVGGSDTFNATYASPSSSSATYAMNLSALGNANSPSGSGARASCHAFWSATKTKANFDTLFGLLRKRFGI